MKPWIAKQVMQTDFNELKVLLQSRIPILSVETHDEPGVVALFEAMSKERLQPLFKWTVLDGFRRLDQDLGNQAFAKQPEQALAQIRSTKKPGIYLLCDFHHYLSEPVIVRMLKEIAQNHRQVPHFLVLVSHELTLPKDLKPLSATYELSLPSRDELEQIVRQVAQEWREANAGQRVQTDRASLEKLIQNLSGLTAHDARSLAYQAIFADGAITHSDVALVMQAKYRLLDQGTALSYHFDTTALSEIGGQDNLKAWLHLRREAFLSTLTGLERPKGILLVGVQGCGKSLAAKSVAGTWGIPLLHLDVGSLYTKYFGETEKNIRDALKTASAMGPCVLWIDEIEKALASGDNDGGTSKRVLGTLLTWMAENQSAVFIVATANDISGLPPELIRKGRLDEIFFVDLPKAESRKRILEVHLERRQVEHDGLDLDRLVEATAGFSGAEIEQAVISGLYATRAQGTCISSDVLLAEVQKTRPLSVVMDTQIAGLREWARERTVFAE